MLFGGHELFDEVYIWGCDETGFFLPAVLLLTFFDGKEIVVSIALFKCDMCFSNCLVYNATAIAWEQNPTLMCLSQTLLHKIFPVDFRVTRLGRRCVYDLTK